MFALQAAMIFQGYVFFSQVCAKTTVYKFDLPRLGACGGVRFTDVAPGPGRRAGRRRRLIAVRQSLIQVADQVARGFQADREADDIGAGTGADQLFRG